MELFVLTCITFSVAVFGSLVGVGGGFLLMPILIFMYPARSHGELTFISLCAVLVNGVAATINYGRMKRIDYRTGLLLGVCTVPTAVAARFALEGISRSQFSHIFGLVLIAIGVFVYWRGGRRNVRMASAAVTPKPHWWRRKMTDARGNVYEYAFAPGLAIGAAASGGFLGSFFGIGGGPLVMPMLTQILRFPPHIATSTSILVLSLSAFAAVGTDICRNVAAGTLQQLPVALALAGGFGAFLGAQVGTRLSHRVSGRGILCLLALAVALAGGRLVFMPEPSKPADEKQQTNHAEPQPSPSPSPHPLNNK